MNRELVELDAWKLHKSKDEKKCNLGGQIKAAYMASNFREFLDRDKREN